MASKNLSRTSEIKRCSKHLGTTSTSVLLHVVFNNMVAQEIAVPKISALFFVCGKEKLSLQHLLASLCFFDYLRMHSALNVQ